jgi:hypothetical protein
MFCESCGRETEICRWKANFNELLFSEMKLFKKNRLMEGWGFSLSALPSIHEPAERRVRGEVGVL